MSAPRRVAILGTRFGAPEIEAEELAGLQVELALAAAGSTGELLQAAAGCEVILAGAPPQFPRDVLARLDGCRAIVRYGVGTETVDREAASDLGILLANVPDYCNEEVATHTLALILACVRRLPGVWNEVRAGRWQIAGVRPLFSTEEQALGIVGFGRIGQAVARKAAPFFGQIFAHDPFVAPETMAGCSARAAELPELLASSDVISLNAPLLPATHHLIGEAALAQVKPTAYLVNTARGGLVDEAALARALQEGRLAGAALDVFEREPPPPDHPLLRCERALITPHMAWYTEQSSVRMRRLASREAARVLRGERPLNLVNPEVLERSNLRL